MGRIDGPRCPRHLRYKGLRKPRLGCEVCLDIYAWTRKYNIREKRKPYPKRGPRGKFAVSMAGEPYIAEVRQPGRLVGQ